ncbi:MAG TPA: ABC transporter permease [Pyrinomonadaceae bacterium]|jgi:simple sugar transport system permease protein|nr:ABC transporter permease [Pyrinomonadaceae bacterium]
MLELFSIALIFSTIRLATPLIFAALGGMFSERAGIINIALEGLMLSGAFTAAVVTYETGNPFLGLLCGAIAGGVLAAAYALMCIKFQADQVVAGFGINFLMLGVPAFISGQLYDSTGSTPQIDKAHQLPEFFGLSVASILVFLLVPVCWYVLYRTPFGLRLRAVGENPEAADTAGVKVLRMRYTGVILSGILAAMGGAYLSIGQSSLFTRNMTAGRGFIALAALIFAKWRPVPTLLTCLFFGFMEAITIQIQGVIKINGEDIPVQFIQIIPYVLTIIVLAGFIGSSRAPKALGIPYQKKR